MNKKRLNRMILVLLLLAGVALVIFFTLRALNENIQYFFSPSDVALDKAPDNRSFRLGGLVVPGSVVRDGVKVRFDLTDNHQTLGVRYQGILPDLFREGQGIIATGALKDNIFVASEVLAKHDENYMPPEVAEALGRLPPKK